MKLLKARVEKGRLKLDVPTDRPDGAVVDLIPADELDDLASMDAADRAALEESLRVSDEEIAGGRPSLPKSRFAA